MPYLFIASSWLDLNLNSYCNSCTSNNGYDLLPSTTTNNPDCWCGCRDWTYFQPDCCSKLEYSFMVLYLPDAAHIMCMSNSFEKCGSSGPGTKCSAINNLACLGEDL